MTIPLHPRRHARAALVLALVAGWTLACSSGASAPAPPDPAATSSAPHSAPPPPAGAEDAAFRVGAYYYTWYYEGHWASYDYVGRHLERPLEPMLGEYISDHPEVINPHIEWASQYGIDFFIISWSMRNSFADQTARKYLLPALAKSNVRQAPYLELVSYTQTDLGLPDFRKRLAEDLRFIGESYLKHPSAYRVGDRPVLVLYASRVLRGDVPGWIREIRQLFASMGLNPYIVGDEVFWLEPDVQRLRAFDAITAYNVYDWPRAGDAGYASASGFLAGAEGLWTRWQDAARAAGVALVPNVMPGYNDRGVRIGENHFVVPRRLTPDGSPTGLFERSIDLATRFTDPSLRMVTVTTFNEWHEWTAIEPTRRAARKGAARAEARRYTQGFPHDDVGFAHLEVLRDRLKGRAAAAPAGVAR